LPCLSSLALHATPPLAAWVLWETTIGCFLSNVGSGIVLRMNYNRIHRHHGELTVKKRGVYGESRGREDRSYQCINVCFDSIDGFFFTTQIALTRDSYNGSRDIYPCRQGDRHPRLEWTISWVGGILYADYGGCQRGEDQDCEWSALLARRFGVCRVIYLAELRFN
jgi:hypothetical protein